MKGFFKKGKWRIDNSGVALITVIAVIGFVSILATIILYVTGKNYYMKSTDIKTKASFYTAETALEQIKAELMKISNDAFQEAYKDTMTQFVSVSDSNAKKIKYNNKFINTFESKFNALLPVGATNSYEDYFKGIIGSTYSAGFTITSTGLEKHANDGYLLIKGIQLQYTSTDGYDTIIKTDLLVTAPKVDWTANQSKTSLDVGVNTTEAFKRKTHDIADSVMYYNWEKW